MLYKELAKSTSRMVGILGIPDTVKFLGISVDYIVPGTSTYLNNSFEYLM